MLESGAAECEGVSKPFSKLLLALQGGRAGNGSGSELRSVETCSQIPKGTPSDFEGPSPVEWRYTSDMTVPRTCLAAASLGATLYAVGGQAGRQIWDTAEVYDAGRDLWVQLGSHMHSERKYTSAGVLHGKSCGRRVGAFAPFPRLCPLDMTLGCFCPQRLPS